MVFPLIPFAIGLGLQAYGGASIYSGYKQREISRYTQGGYERALADWNKNVASQGRVIQYPELSFPGSIYREQTNQAISYVNSAQAVANMATGAYTAGMSAYNKTYHPTKLSNDLQNLYM